MAYRHAGADIPISLPFPGGQYDLYQTKEVFAYVRSLGLQISDHHADYLIKRGALGRRQVRGKGRARSVTSYWSFPQRELLREVLTMEQRCGASLVDQCVLPVAKWLYWGEPSGVDLRQIGCAMTTWADVQRTRIRRSFQRVKRNARTLVQTIGHASAPEKSELVEQLATMSYNWDYPSEDKFRDWLRLLIDPDLKGEAVGPQGARFSPEAVSHLITARIKGVDAILGGEVFDAQWEWARTFCLFAYQHYQEQQPLFATQAAGTRVAHLFQAERDLGGLYSMACLDLATVLGIGLLDPVLPHLPACWHLRSWEEGNVQACVESKLVPSSSFGPDGCPLMQVQVGVSLKMSE